MKINKLIITLIAAAFIFMGCSNSLDSAPSASGTYSVTGKISFASSSGAAPVVFTPALDGRTATASFNNEHLSLNLYAYKYNEQTQSIDTRKKHDNVVVDQSGNFVFCFEEKGRYIIYAEVLRNGKKCATGTTKVEITGYTPNSISISTSPNVSEDGKIQLSVSAATDITPQIKKVSVSWISSFSGHVEENADGTHESSEYEAAMLRRDDVLNGKYNKSFDVVNGTATISYDNFPGGNWLAKISFEDETENSLYSCQEIINVYPTFTTNRWYGSSPALNNGNFKITKNMVTNYDAERVPTFNNILLWNHSIWNEGQDMEGDFYYLVDEKSIGSFVAPTVESYEDLPAGAEVYTKFTTGSGSRFDDTFFDSEGNIYLALHSSDAPSPGSGLFSSRSDWNHVDWDDLSFSWEMGRAFTIDLKTNIAYSLEQNGDIYVNKFSNLISSKGEQSEHTQLIIDIESPQDFCVYNNIAYVLNGSGDGVYAISSFDLTSEEDPVPAIKTISFNLDYIIGTNRSSGAWFSDMLYQDGAIYLLYKEGLSYMSAFSSQMYNRGAVICVNLADGSAKSTGLTSNIMDKSKIRLRAFGSFDGDNYPLFTDEEHTTKFIPETATNGIDTFDIKNYYPDIYTPADNELCFCGPTKFVAVKPKKLVISDEGLAFYMQDGELCCKNVNRIVYVDLGSFAVSSIVNVDSSVSLNADYGLSYFTSNSIGVPAPISNVYYLINGSGAPKTFQNDCYYLGIMNGDCE